MHYFFLLFQFFITGFLRIYAAFSTFVCEFWGNLKYLSEKFVKFSERNQGHDYKADYLAEIDILQYLWYN